MDKETVIIDIAAEMTDKTSEGAQKVKTSVAAIDDETKKVKTSMDAMGRSGAASADKLTSRMKSTEAQAKRLTREKWNMRLDAVDHASSKVTNVLSKATSLSGKAFKFSMSVVDYATKPLRSIFNLATSLKTIVIGIAAGKATQAAIGKPIGLADSYAGAMAGFETALKSKEKAVKLMGEIDEFARTTPLNTANVIEQSRRLLAMGWDDTNLVHDIGVMGNAASATGLGDEGLRRIALALSQIRSKGKLAAQEIENDWFPTAIVAKKAA